MKIYRYWHLCLALLLSIGCLSCAQNKVTFELKDDEKLIEFTTDRFTLPNLHVTPDGKNIIFDVLGDIYKVPIEGGKAEVLLQDNNWKRAGKLSPDGQTLAYISDETGVFQVWTINLKTREKKVYPIKEFIHDPLYAYWKINNKLYIPDKNGIHEFSLDSEGKKTFPLSINEESPITKKINRRISVAGNHSYYYYKKHFWAYDMVAKLDMFIGKPPLSGLITMYRASPSGRKLIYYKDVDDDYTKQELVYWDTESNNHNILSVNKKPRYFTNLNYSFDFIDDAAIILSKDGEIVRMDIYSGVYESIPIEVDVKKVIKRPLHREPKYINDSIITASVLRNPVTQKDLNTIYFGAFGKLQSYDKVTEQIIEVYPEEDRFEVSPSLSPDGKYLAFTTWNDCRMGHVYIRELKTGKEYKITEKPGRYINPAWSPNGREIIFIVDETEAKMGIPRQAPGSNTYNLPLNIHKISFRENDKIKESSKSEFIQRIYPFSVLPRRFYPVPVYHPKGHSIYITTRNHDDDLPVMLQIDLESKEIIDEKIIPFHTDEVVISPDRKHIAFILDETIHLSEYPHNTIIHKMHYPEDVHEVQNIELNKSIKVFEVAPSYLSWQDEYILMWGSAEEIYTYDLRTGETEKIADITVQKPRDIPKTQYALTNARIVTINKQDEILEKGTVLVKDNRIEVVGKVGQVMIPENYKVFNLEGKTIMPGLIDVHAHYHLSPFEFINQQEFQYIGNLAYGVTTIYDPSVNVLDYREQAQMVESGVLIGPRVFASGNIIMNFPIYYDYKYIDGLEDTDRLLESIQKLKVHGPIKEYGRRNRIDRINLRESAKSHDLTITTHQSNYSTALSRIIDGYTALEHEISSFEIYKDAVSFIAQSKVNYTPTFIVRPRIGEMFFQEMKREYSKLKYFNGELLFYNIYGYKLENDFIKKLENEITQLESKNNIKRAATTLNEIVNSGGIVSVGGHGNPFSGIGTHWELWSFTYGGMSESEALRAATINGARKLDLQEEIGSIEKGKLADMVVLNSNPLERIYNSTDILYCIQNGNIYEAETMKQIYPIERELQPWGWNNSMILNSMEKIYQVK